MSDIPTLRDELDRKVMETLEWLIEGGKAGLLSGSESAIGLQALFKAVSGLVDKDFINVITGADSFGFHRQPVRMVLFNSATDAVTTFSWMPSSSEVEFVRIVPGKHQAQRSHKLFDSPKLAAGYLNDVRSHMIGLGWQEIE